MLSAPYDPVVITGMGAITALGNDPASTWESLLAGSSAASHWPDLEDLGFKNTFACRIQSLDVDPLCRGREMLLLSLQQAVASACMTGFADTGVFLGTTMGESAAFEQAAEGVPHDLSAYNGYSFVTAARRWLGSNGPGACFGNACAAGNYAIGSAVRAIQSGRCTTAVAGGVEPFSKIAMVGFSRSRAMASKQCKPFDANRQGMLLGEGCAILFLEKLSSAIRRGVRPVCSVISLGLSSDAHHITAPHPEGAGIRSAMRRALASAHLSAEQVDWVCAHGSGTQASDAAEAIALEQHFHPHSVPVSAYKGALGHTLGAATAIEAMITALGLSHGIIPATTGHDHPDADMRLDIVARTRELPELRTAINCGYAFGGHNSALVMTKINA